MISVKEAENIVNESLPRMPVVERSLKSAYGYVLAEDIKSDRPQPPYDRVMMDGIAVRFEAWQKGVRRFKICGVQAAGQPAGSLNDSQGCLEVMTGAVLPRGCDSVVPVEAIEISDGVARVRADHVVKAGDYIHRRGDDAPRGKMALKKGAVLLGPALSLAASVGKERLRVYQRPSVAIVSTGDEVVAVGRKPLDYQIRRSNGPAIQAVVENGLADQVKLWHVRDHLPSLIKKLSSSACRSSDVLIVIGGVSKGKFDYVRQALTALGFHEKFCGVRQRPGKPFCFGKIPKGPVVFCLPGNPWSSQVVFYRYVVPALRLMSGESVKERPQVRCLGEFSSLSDGWTLFAPVRQTSNPDIVEFIQTSCSGDESVLGETDGFIQVDTSRFKSGSSRLAPFYPWRS